MAIVAYLVPVLGPLFILLLHKPASGDANSSKRSGRVDRFAVYHAKQALAINVAAILIPLIWAIIGWLLLWIPYGAVVASFTFALVIAGFLLLVVAWIIGIVNVLKAEVAPVPIVGRWFVIM